MSAAERGAVADRELSRLFSDFSDFSRVILAVSGGPDSTALLWLAARWRATQSDGPMLVAATIDHRLRREAKKEAAAVAKLARKLQIPHYTLAWSGAKPKTGLQEAARSARYSLLLGLARKVGADAIATAHTRDDQAETILHRIGRGSGIGGLAGIRRRRERDGIVLLRPLLGVAKARLISTLGKARLAFADDPSNRDPRFLRARLRQLAPGLEREGIDAAKLALLARRLDRANEAIEAAAADAWKRALNGSSVTLEFEASRYFALPAEIALRLLARAIDDKGHEGPAELGKLEVLYEALVKAKTAREPLKRTLAGAAVTLAGSHISVDAAPPRRKPRRRSLPEAAAKI
ncbi:MAG TPA: tRNA lysidine(34) synthetase TilS [Xanthobacteraceae bacterium]|nr:tRNA lysidine(34) synthetase TilS [Xanthobacteraceae bacterium]